MFSYMTKLEVIKIQKEIHPLIKLNKLTFRQYMALTLIFSDYILKKRLPTSMDLKNLIEFQTDRMLDVTLKALADKGFLEYSGDLKYKIRKEALKFAQHFVDPLLLINQYTPIEKIHNILIVKEHVKLNPKENPNSYGSISQTALEQLNSEHRSFHRWYSYLADFPPDFILSKLKQYDISKNQLVLDPFSGSGTTLITAKMFGINSIGFDVNPIPAFVSKTVTSWDIDIKQFRKQTSIILSKLKSAIPILAQTRLENDLVDTMGSIEFHQWLKPRVQNEVIFTRELINQIDNESIKNLFKLALIESSTESSNVSFCPGTSFYPFRKKPEFYNALFNQLNIMLEDLLLTKQIKKVGKTTVYNEDSRKISSHLKPNSIDFIISSPPYPNDMEYTRQTRLDLYLLNYVKNINDVQKIKRKMVKGSTKLIFKDSNSAKYVEKFDSVQKVANQVSIALDGKVWGWDYPRMIREYFGDMYLCLKEYLTVLKSGSYVNLMVGDQTSKHVLIPVGKILQEMAEDIGYDRTNIELFRVRKSTLHKLPLNEEILILRS